MRVLLLTTLPNKVAEMLERQSSFTVDVIDFNRVDKNKNEFLAGLRQIVADKHYAILLSYRCPWIIPADIRAEVKHCINIHPLSLPEFKGLNPWKKLLTSGRTTSEVVIHLMNDEPDSGKIMARRSYRFEGDLQTVRSTADKTAASLLKIKLCNAKSKWYTPVLPMEIIKNNTFDNCFLGIENQLIPLKKSGNIESCPHLIKKIDYAINDEGGIDYRVWMENPSPNETNILFMEQKPDMSQVSFDISLLGISIRSLKFR